jgi:hypothetical protein
VSTMALAVPPRTAAREGGDEPERTKGLFRNGGVYGPGATASGPARVPVPIRAGRLAPVRHRPGVPGRQTVVDVPKDWIVRVKSRVDSSSL